MNNSAIFVSKEKLMLSSWIVDMEVFVTLVQLISGKTLVNVTYAVNK